MATRIPFTPSSGSPARDNASWADISGAVSASYAVTVTEANYTDYYRVAVTINGVIVADELLAEAAK